MPRFMNEVRRGPLFPLAHTAAVVAYRPVQIGKMICIPQQDAVANETVEYEILGVCGHYRGAAKEGAAGKAWGLGVLLYWSSADNRFTVDSGDGILAGYAARAAAAGDTTGEVFMISRSLVA